MTTWAEARRSGQQARAGVQAERAGSGGFNGALPITGKVFYCRDHAQLYQEDKVWEAKHQKSM